MEHRFVGRYLEFRGCAGRNSIWVSDLKWLRSTPIYYVPLCYTQDKTENYNVFIGFLPSQILTYCEHEKTTIFTTYIIREFVPHSCSKWPQMRFDSHRPVVASWPNLHIGNNTCNTTNKFNKHHLHNPNACKKVLTMLTPKYSIMYHAVSYICLSERLSLRHH